MARRLFTTGGVLLAAVLDLLGFDRQHLICELIEFLRPGAGHRWSTHTEPICCSACGALRGSLYRKGRWR